MPEKQTLIAQMIVRNESKRYLKQVLDSISEYAKKIVIIDDCSTDETPKICKSYPKVILKQRHGKSLWATDEAKLRGELWEEVRKLKPDWVVTVDADEIFDKSFKKRLPELLASPYDTIAFRICDMWDKNDFYRIDGYWSPTFKRLFRFEDVPFGLTGKFHCGPIPRYAVENKNCTCYNDIRVKHFAWMTPEDRKAKMKIREKVPVTGLNAEHRESVFKPARLKKWTEEIKFPSIKICTPVKNRAWCLKDFLQAIVEQDYPKEKISFLFIENDSTDETLKILIDWSKKWKKKYEKIEITSIKFQAPPAEHQFSDQTLANLTYMRNFFVDNIGDNDYIFNVDSDVILRDSRTLRHVALSDRDIIAEIFWTRWDKLDQQLMPQVWQFGGYDLSEDFLAMLRTKGTYTVGGLGACNLISNYAIEKGCRFDQVENLPLNMRGEDRHFCIRAKVLKFNLWVDSYFPAKHLEKFDYDLREKFAKTRAERLPGNRISLVMLVNNEEYMLENFLYRMSNLFDEIIIVITESTDGSREIAEQYTDKIYDFKWCDDYSKVRNFAISKATCPWIFYADPDENYGVQNLHHFDKMVTTENAIGFIFMVFNYRGGRSQPSISEAVRLFRNLPEIKFTGIVHETLDETISKYMKEHPGTNLRLSPIPMFHWGFVLGTKERAEKLAYYKKLNERQLKENPEDSRPYYNLAMHLLEEPKRLEEGIKLLEKSIELNPSFYQPRRELALYYLRQTRAQFQEGVKILPQSHPFYAFMDKAIKWINNFLGEGQGPRPQMQT